MPRMWLATQVTTAALMLGLLALVPAMAAQGTVSDAAAPSAAAAPAATAESSCSATISRTIVPDEIRSCDQSDVTLQVRSYCPGEPMDVVLVLSAVSNRPVWHGVARQWHRAAVEALEMSIHPNVKTGVVAVRNGGVILLELSTDEREVSKAISISFDPNVSGLWGFGAAFGRAAEMLSRVGRRDHKIIVFVGHATSGEPNYSDWVKGARTAKRAADTLVVGCPVVALPESCSSWGDWWKEASPGYYFEGTGTGAFSSAIQGLIAQSVRAKVAEIAVDETWPAGLALVPGTVSPAPALVDTAARRLRWSFTAPITQAITLTYQVQPQAQGVFTFSGGTTAITDTARHGAVLPLPTGALAVTGPCITPTDVPTVTPPPTPTATPLPTDTPAPSATATPVPTLTPASTATPAPRPAYLPVALGERCVPSKRRVDVALVIDASTSMEELVRPGWSKLDAARVAARGFLSALHLDVGDQAAIVAFNGGVSMLAGLTSDQAALLAALDRITVAPQTRIHLGVREAQVALAGPRHRPENARAMIVLTDGRSNPDSPELAVEAAAAAKAAGITVFTIGLGGELDFLALERMASKPEYSYEAPTADQLEAIYRAIAVEIPCSGETFWAGR